MENEDDLMFQMDEIHTPESGVSTSSTVSENPFFAGIENYRGPRTPIDDDDDDDIGPETPTTIQVSSGFAVADMNSCFRKTCA